MTRRRSLILAAVVLLVLMVAAWVIGRNALQNEAQLADSAPPVPLEVAMGGAYQMVDEFCLPAKPWEGPVRSNPWMLLAWHPSGSYAVCTTTSRLTAEDDPAYDYYIATASVRFVTQERTPVDVPWDSLSASPQATMYLESSAPARGNVFQATNPDRPLVPCLESGATGASSAVFEGPVSAPETADILADGPELVNGGCEEHFVRSELTATGATWQFDGRDVRDAIVVSYYQKVDQAVVPTFTTEIGG